MVNIYGRSRSMAENCFAMEARKKFNKMKDCEIGLRLHRWIVRMACRSRYMAEVYFVGRRCREEKKLLQVGQNSFDQSFSASEPESLLSKLPN